MSSIYSMPAALSPLFLGKLGGVIVIMLASDYAVMYASKSLQVAPRFAAFHSVS